MKLIYKILILALPVIILMTVGLAWLALALLFGGALVLLFSSSFKWVSRIKRSSLLSGTLSLLGIFVIAIFLRVFVMEIYAIPSGSMEASLLPGDYIVMSKLNYGPSLPRSPFEIPWLNIFFFFSQEAMAKGDSPWWDYKRFGGYSYIERNDVVLFKHPYSQNTTMIKRCIGLPGDQFQMKEGQAFCNGERVESPVSLINLYQLRPANKKLAIRQLDSLKVWLPNNIYVDSVWEVFLTKPASEFLAVSPAVDAVKLKTLNRGEGRGTFPHHEDYSWSIDQFGPVQIPAKGMKIPINPKNLLFYGHILLTFEKVHIEEKEGKFYAAGKEIAHYTFTQNYYFMLGDNRNHSEDSRFMGFVPEENIIGKGTFILFSKNDQGFKWNRLLKPIQ